MSGTVLDAIEEGARVPGALVVYLGSDLFAQYVKEEYPFITPEDLVRLHFYCGQTRIIRDLGIPPDSMEFLAVPEGVDEVIS